MKKKIIFYIVDMILDAVMFFFCSWVLFDFFSNMYINGLNTIGDLMNHNYFGGWSIISSFFASYLFAYSLCSFIEGILKLRKIKKGKVVLNENI